MTAANVPLVPVAGSAVLRATLALTAAVVRWLKDFARARRHRREALMLAGLDRRMLADIGLTRSDVTDAFSEPFWEDPTALLRERAIERRLNRGGRSRAPGAGQPRVEPGFARPVIGRPARQVV